MNGRGEAARMLLAHAKVQYKDCRVQGKDWPALKPTMPGGGMPTIVFKDGKKMGQSQNIVRYLGKCYGYYPKDSLEAAKVDYMVANYMEAFGAFNVPHAGPADKKAANIDEIFDKVLPAFMKKLVPNLKETGFLCGTTLTIADFWIGGLYVNLMNNPAVGFAPERWAEAKVHYPAFAAYGERFAKELTDYLSKRPPRPI